MGTCPSRCHTNMTVLDNSEPEPDGEDVLVSLYNYPSFGDTELTMHLGDRLTVLSDDGDFVMVRSATTGRDSYIPSNYTSKVSHRWLFTGISRFKAIELLMLPQNNNGTFLIRDSETNHDCYSLSILRRWSPSLPSSLTPPLAPPLSDCVKHYRILRLQNGWVYISAGLTFPSLHQLVQHYSEHADGLCCRLTRPCHIYGSDACADSATPIPTAVRQPTVNWKDITRSVIFKRKRTESDHSLVSEGLREAISSYLQMTEGTDHSWDT